MSATSNCCPSFSSSEYHLNSTLPPEMVDWLAGAVIARSAETGLRLTVATSAETVSREERDESMIRVGWWKGGCWTKLGCFDAEAGD